MDAMGTFVCESNVARYRSMLETEIDPRNRSTVIRLLVTEESKLGFAAEQLAGVERYIMRCRELVSRQEVLVDEMRRNGHDVGRANALLETLIESLTIHEQHRGRIRDGINRMSA